MGKLYVTDDSQVYSSADQVIDIWSGKSSNIPEIFNGKGLGESKFTDKFGGILIIKGIEERDDGSYNVHWLRMWDNSSGRAGGLAPIDIAFTDVCFCRAGEKVLLTYDKQMYSMNTKTREVKKLDEHFEEFPCGIQTPVVIRDVSKQLGYQVA